jgi:hypothetical protein
MGDQEEPTGSTILGGFFVYRARPTESKKVGELESKVADIEETNVSTDAATQVETEKADVVGAEKTTANAVSREVVEGEAVVKTLEGGAAGDFAQKGEITGMVLIKESGDRQFFTYVPIDSKTYSVDKFMEYFKDTIFNNSYDNNSEKVFDMKALGSIVNQLIVQKVEKDIELVEESSSNTNNVPSNTNNVPSNTNNVPSNTNNVPSNTNTFRPRNVKIDTPIEDNSKDRGFDFFYNNDIKWNVKDMLVNSMFS